MIDIAEQICKAVDQIVTKKIESINFDTTIIATIEKADQAKQQKYTCSNGSAQFIAFSKDDTYKVGDTVLVTIPNNDYDQQKIIIGKYVAKESKPFNYVEPFDTFIDVSANLIDTTQTNNLSLLANEIIEGQEDVKIIEKLLYSQFSSKGYKGFNRLGLKGQFRSWLAELETISGNYGYRLEILSSMGTLIKNNSDMMEVLVALGDLRKKILLTKQLPNNWETVINKIPEDWFINKNYQAKDVINEFKTADSIKEKLSLLLLILSEKLKISNIYLSSNDMYGNPYNFQSYFEQEKVYDISDIGEILGVSLWFYEETGSFKDRDGELIPWRFDPNDALTRRDDNLFTKDPYICLGYDLSGFNEEQAILYSLDSNSFYIQDDIPEEQNYKTIRLRWLHQFEDDRIQVINEATKMDKEYEIRWYRFELGKPSADEYSGVYWVRQESTEESPFNFLLKPKPNVDIEQIKAIILYGDKVIESNILTFKSDDPEGATNASTQKTLAGLQIWCEDNSYGNYYVYDPDGTIIQSNGTDGLSEHKELLMYAKFADASILTVEDDVDVKAEKLKEAKTITWEFPLQNSMIIVDGINYRGDSEGDKPWILDGYFTSDDIVKVDVENNVIKITRSGNINSGLAINAEQKYRIKGNYDAAAFNNTVKCTIVKNSKIYSTTKEFSFGIRGTSGADVTVEIDFNNNKTALTAEPFEGASLTTLKLTARIIDSSNKEVPLDDLQYENVQFKWDWFAYNQNLIGGYISSEQKGEYTLLYLTELKSELDKYFQDSGEVLNIPDKDTLIQLIENINLVEFNTQELYDAEVARLTQYYENTLSLNEIDALINGIDENKSEVLTIEQIERLDKYYLPKVQNKYYLTYGDIQIDSYDRNVCVISQPNNLDLRYKVQNDEEIQKDYFQIIKCTITGWGDYGELIKYKAIPIRKDQRFRNLLGVTEIVYNSKGDIFYNKNPFELWGCKNKEDIEASTDTVNTKIQKLPIENVRWEIYNPFKEKVDLIGNVVNNIFQPCPIYTKDVNMYGVRAILITPSENEGESDIEEVVWQQPLVIMQNRYPSATLNSWNGKGIMTDENTGTIVAPAIAAGRKESDNSFSGVMLGDWSKTSTDKSISTQTGLYGFHKGAQSFGFKEDGTAFIGKSGSGRINFDGNKGTISSDDWLFGKTGMLLDLDDGHLQMRSRIDDFYELVERPKEANNQTYHILRNYKLVTNDMTYAENEIYYKPKRYYSYVFSNAIFPEPSVRHLFYTYVKPEGQGSYQYIQLTSETVMNKDTTYYFPYSFTSVNITAMEFELNATQYYIKKDSYISVADSKIPYNTSRYDYYKKYENKYRGITVSAKEKNYPLSIGMYDNLSQRPFRVQWDGKVYIDSGEFNGIITAKAGKIGGWEITDDSLIADDIILNSSDSSISGGKLIAADGNMDLIGKFSVYKDISSDYPLGTLGHVQGSLNIYNPETGEDELEHPDGVGLVVNLHANEASKGTSQLLVTERHVALTTGDGSTVGSYLALRPKSFAIGLVGENAGVAISITRYNEKGEEYENTGKLGIKFNVPAEQQFGIYARFA